MRPLFLVAALLLAGCAAPKPSAPIPVQKPAAKRPAPPLPPMPPTQTTRVFSVASDDAAKSSVAEEQKPFALYWEHDGADTDGFLVERTQTFEAFSQIGVVFVGQVWRNNGTNFTYKYPLTNQPADMAFYRVGANTSTNPPLALRIGPDRASEIDLPGGTEVVQRRIARSPDGVNFYGYYEGNTLTVAAFMDDGRVAKLASLNRAYFELGCEMTFAAGRLFVMGSAAQMGSVWQYDVTGWPVSVTAHPPELFLDPQFLIRWPVIASHPDGRVMAVWYEQGAGTFGRVAYRNAAGVWTEGIYDMCGYVYNEQPAGIFDVVAVGEGFEVGAIKDSWIQYMQSRFAAGETLEQVSAGLIIHGFPYHGDQVANRECVPHGEFAYYFRMYPNGDGVRVLYNNYDFLVTYPGGMWLSSTCLSYCAVAADGSITSIRMTAQRTERGFMDYAVAGGKIYLFPVNPYGEAWPDLNASPLHCEDGSLVATGARALPIGALEDPPILVYSQGNKLKVRWL